jgi:hypothetical protein
MTSLTHKGIRFPFESEINVDCYGKLYYKESGCEKNYLSNKKCDPTINVGKTFTLSPNKKSCIENVGTCQKSILNFNLAKGDKGPIGPSGPIGNKGSTGSPLMILFSSGEYFTAVSSNIANNARKFATVNFSSFSLILNEKSQITNSSINDIIYFNTDAYLNAFIIPRNGNIVNSNFLFKPRSPAVVPSGVATLIVRFYISSPNNGIFKPLDGTNTDVILSNSIKNGDRNILKSKSGGISVAVNRGDLITCICFVTSSEDSSITQVNGILSGGISIS